MNGFKKLQDEIKKDKKRLDAQAERHKTLHRMFQGWAIALTALTTIVAGSGLILPDSMDDYAKFTVLCLAAITTAVNAWAGMRRSRELWQNEREAYYELVDIEREMKVLAADGKPGADELHQFQEKVNAALGSSTRAWRDIVSRPAAQTAPAPTGGGAS